jgi:hypothetical protein
MCMKFGRDGSVGEHVQPQGKGNSWGWMCREKPLASCMEQRHAGEPWGDTWKMSAWNGTIDEGGATCSDEEMRKKWRMVRSVCMAACKAHMSTWLSKRWTNQWHGGRHRSWRGRELGSNAKARRAKSLGLHAMNGCGTTGDAGVRRWVGYPWWPGQEKLNPMMCKTA